MRQIFTLHCYQNDLAFKPEPSALKRVLEGYIENDPLIHVGDFHVDAIDEQEALDKAWVIGNREGFDIDGLDWPRQFRSMSISDVVIIGETAYACEPVGWRVVDLRKVEA